MSIGLKPQYKIIKMLQSRFRPKHMKMSRLHRHIDVFGQGINFLFKEQELYTTVCGMIVSVLMFIVIASQFANKFIKMWTMADTSFQNSIERGVSMHDVLSFEETNFNIMFGVVRNDFLLEYVDIHGYLEWVVQKEDNDFTVFPPKLNITKLGFHRCNDTDEFSPSQESQVESNILLKKMLYCVDDAKQIQVKGNRMSEVNENVKIELHRCVGKSHCKNETEINDFLETHNQFVILYNTQRYEPNKYDENVIDYRLKGEVRPITAGSARLIRQFNIRKETLESTQAFTGHGFFPIERTFYTFYEAEEQYLSTNKTSLGGILIGSSLDVVNHTREIYSLLNVLEEIGGIYSILFFIGFAIVLTWEVCFGSKTKSFLVRHIFKQSALQRRDDTLDFEKSQKRIERSDTRSLLSLKSRQKAKIERIAYQRVLEELDIVKFIRKQMMFDLLVKEILTKQEIFLMKNHPSFVIGQGEENSSVQDSFDSKPIKVGEIKDCRYFKQSAYAAKESDRNSVELDVGVPEQLRAQGNQDSQQPNHQVPNPSLRSPKSAGELTSNLIRLNIQQNDDMDIEDISDSLFQDIPDKTNKKK